jgi:hypothetical protein
VAVDAEADRTAATRAFETHRHLTLLGTLLGGRKVPWVILGPCFRHPSGEVMDRNSELQRRSQRFLMAMAPSYATTSLAQNDGSFGGGGRSHSG